MTVKSELKYLKKKDEEIMREMKRIERAERIISQQEKHILREETEILDDIKEKPLKVIATNGVTRRELMFLKKHYIQKFSRHKLLYTLTVLVGVVLVWRGVWNMVDAGHSHTLAD